MKQSHSFYSLGDIFDFLASDFDRAVCEMQNVNLFSGGFPPYNAKINEKTNDLRFEFALAGYNKNEIEIAFDGDYMILEVKPEEKEEKSDFKFIQRGIKGGKGKLKIAVPESKFNRDEAKADFKDGILVVDIPRKEEKKPKLLDIN